MQNKKSYLSLNKSKRERGGITFLALWMQWEGREAREVWPEMVGNLKTTTCHIIQLLPGESMSGAKLLNTLICACWLFIGSI